MKTSDTVRCFMGRPGFGHWLCDLRYKGGGPLLYGRPSNGVDGSVTRERVPCRIPIPAKNIYTPKKKCGDHQAVPDVPYIRERIVLRRVDLTHRWAVPIVLHQNALYV